eukprot:364573-Chlamydomonas_euryale.AAC.4
MLPSGKLQCAYHSITRVVFSLCDTPAGPGGDPVPGCLARLCARGGPRTQACVMGDLNHT